MVHAALMVTAQAVFRVLVEHVRAATHAMTNRALVMEINASQPANQAWETTAQIAFHLRAEDLPHGILNTVLVMCMDLLFLLIQTALDFT
jgi:hypothetical protein